MSKDIDFCHSGEIYLANRFIELLNAATKTGLWKWFKTCDKKVSHRAAEATGEFAGNNCW